MIILNFTLIENWADFAAVAIALLSLSWTIVYSIINGKKTASMEAKSNALSEQSNRLTEIVNSKEHDLSENLKYEVLKLISNVRAIDSKAAHIFNEKEAIDYSIEIESLLRIQASPEYLLFLKSIKDEGERFLMEERIRLLTLPSMPKHDIRKWTHLVLEDLKKLVNLDKVVQEISEDYYNNWNDLVKDLCEIKGVYASYNEDAKIVEDEFKSRFFKYLYDKGFRDPSILIFYGIIYHDRKIAEQAMDAGADLSITDNEVIRQYQSEYDTYLWESFKDFYTYLIEVKKCKDPDVLYIYATKTNNHDMMALAKESGANERVTDKTIINRYIIDLKEFMKI